MFLIALITNSVIISSIALGGTKEVKMTTSTRKQLNVFFSNFSEAHVAPFTQKSLKDAALINFGIRHNLINRSDKFEFKGGYAYISASKVQETVTKYFGKQIKNIKTSNYSNGKYRIAPADGEAVRFSQINKLYSKGNGYYTAYITIFEASSGFTGDIHGNMSSWKRTAENPYDIPSVVGKMKATIKKQGSRYILIDYLKN